MKIIDKKLLDTADIIDSKLIKVSCDNREEVSTDILANIRHFCEAFMYKVYDEEEKVDLYQTHDNLKKVRKYFKEKYFDIYRFHSLLDESVGHIAFGSSQSEALTIKYIPKLIELKDFLARNYNINVLKNIDKYPLDLDESVTKFYEKILHVLLCSKSENNKFTRNQYFVRKKSMKYLNGYVFYEYVFDVSEDKTNKFNTFVCYSLKNIKFNYDLKLLLSKRKIFFLNTMININVIYDYEYSIRPCAFKNVLYLINIDADDGKRDKEYLNLMNIIKKNSISLVDIIDGKIDISLTPSGYYSNFINSLKMFIGDNNLGTNIIRFLLLDMRNSTIKAQTYRQRGNMPEFNEDFNDLRICLGTKSFELMPFAFNPKEVKPSIRTLIELYDVSNREEEILYHCIVDYINKNNTLFLKPSDIGYSDDIFKQLMEIFNDKLVCFNTYYCDHMIIEECGYFTIKSYYETTKKVIKMALELSKVQNIDVNSNYSSNVYLKDNQKTILEKVFSNSSIELVTGSAGTGKTTLIKEFMKNNTGKRILCLATTNTAINNLKIEESDCCVVYKNITQFENEKKRGSVKNQEHYEIIIIDEASFISTKSIFLILQTYKDSNFLIVGDPEQIESIDFGNWFYLLLSILKKENVVNSLDVELRTESKEMEMVWKEVREGKKNNILELLSVFEMTEKISEKIFNIGENEIVLCLNYDGLYGINNINRYLQDSKDSVAYEYQQNLYKIGDPVVFIINDYSQYGIYNNLKGKIVDIKDDSEKIFFKIELFDSVNYIGHLSYEISIEKENGIYYAVVEKLKYYNDRYDNDMDTRTKLPFQISYAMSIHKAQGLEFDSVKIVITKEADELITKNIFYTAVTRAKKRLKIYWEPEVANNVLDNIEKSANSNKVDLSIINEYLKVNQ